MTEVSLIAPDPNATPSKAKNYGGSNFDAFNDEIMHQACAALWTDKSNVETRQRRQQACIEALVGIAPKDEVEGMLAAQMVATHSAAMDCFRRAMIGEQTFQGRNQNLAFGNKLSQTYVRLVEALDKHRGKGQQKVTVEHVHVHQGGQAIVGNVTTGGSAPFSEGQAHAKSIAHAQEPALQGALTPDRQAMPMPSNA